MKIAIVGAGVSGLVAAYLLSRRHEITLFDGADYAGGHAHTVRADAGGRRFDVDTGFIVFNDRTYPNFVRLLNALRVPSQETTMSFSVSCERTGLEYNGTSLNRLFAQRRNLISPRFLGMTSDILRFNRTAAESVARAPAQTVGEFLAQTPYGAMFRDCYLVPMGAAIWSCPPERFLRFPLRFVVDFFHNHGLLQAWNRPQWRTIAGGSHRYVAALSRAFAHRIRLRTPVRAVRRLETHVDVRTDEGTSRFDEVVFACHSDQALAIVEDASATEANLLRAFPYQPNDVVLHTDAAQLPASRRAWAAWNYRIPRRALQSAATVTYHMNALQRLDAPVEFCVTLNATNRVDAELIRERFTYHHPLYTSQRDDARRRYAAVIRVNRTSYCGAYWGFGFHEDGVNSALTVCRAFGEEL
jgi:uncharacterized protein